MFSCTQLYKPDKKSIIQFWREKVWFFLW
jgi:hypothetical protein